MRMIQISSSTDQQIKQQVQLSRQYYMLQVQQEISGYKSSIELSFRQSVKQIKTIYAKRIDKLEKIAAEKDEHIAKVESSLKSVNSELASLKIQYGNLQQYKQKYRGQIDHLKDSLQTLQAISQKQLSLKQDTIKQLEVENELQKKQIQKLINQQEVFSSSYSTLSKRQSPSFSVEISEIFKNSPHQILNFLNSIPGEYTKDPKEQGEMTCMFVSKDGLSLQKFVKINRTFLKRTIKEHQKRFRFVLIHKPDKQ